MQAVKTDRKIKLNKKYQPFATDADEIYINGFFHFNISQIIKDIDSKKLLVQSEKINLKNWLKEHSLEFSVIDKEHLKTVDTNKPILQAEIRINKYEIIDGNHRIQKAFDEGLKYINSYKLQGEQLFPYFMEKQQYEAYVKYWNEKLLDYKDKN